MRYLGSVLCRLFFSAGGFSLLSVLVLGSVENNALAAQVYKSVDAAGHVTYSEKLPASAVKVETLDVIDKPPDPEREAKARREFDELKANNDRLQAQRESLAATRAKEAEQAPVRVVEKQIIVEKPAAPQVVYAYPPYPEHPHRHHHHDNEVTTPTPMPTPRSYGMPSLGTGPLLLLPKPASSDDTDLSPPKKRR